MKVVLLSIALVLVSFLLLGVKVLFIKGGRFPSGHSTPELRRRGIGCANNCEHSKDSTNKHD